MFIDDFFGGFVWVFDQKKEKEKKRGFCLNSGVSKFKKINGYIDGVTALYFCMLQMCFPEIWCSSANEDEVVCLEIIKVLYYIYI